MQIKKEVDTVKMSAELPMPNQHLQSIWLNFLTRDLANRLNRSYHSGEAS